MKNSVKKEIEKIIKSRKLNCSIEEFKDTVSNTIYDWWRISKFDYLSEDFIREFKDEVDWQNISKWQSLSENFIREFKNRLYLPWILEYQNLSDKIRNELVHEKTRETFPNGKAYKCSTCNGLEGKPPFCKIETTDWGEPSYCPFDGTKNCHWDEIKT